jgi:hypothetical protein
MDWSFLWIITGFILFYIYKEYETYRARELLKNRVLYFISGAILSGLIIGSSTTTCKCAQKNKFNTSKFTSKSFNY